MVQQGGLGRGLSSLIPQKNTNNKSNKTPKNIGGNSLKKSRVKSKRASVRDNSVEESNYFGGNYAKKEELAKARQTPVKNPRRGGDNLLKMGVPKKAYNSNDVTGSAGLLNISVGDIMPNPYQPRSDFNEEKLQELANSIAEHGVIQPLIVTGVDDGYELIAGERRLEASKIAGLKTVPVIKREANSENKAEWALIENIQREDLNPIEEAEAYNKMKNEFHLTQDEISKKVGKSRSAIANILRLLNLPTEIRDALVRGRITEGHARTILAIKDPKKRIDLFNSILKEGLNVRQVESAVKNVNVSKSYNVKGSVDPDLLDIENKIADNLNTKVKIRGIKGNGKILIDYYSEEELGEIVSKLKGDK